MGDVMWGRMVKRIVTGVGSALKPESDHLLHLDALRLIASTGIVVCHLAGNWDAGFLHKKLAAAVSPLAFFVDMFFILSGFVIAFVYSGKIVDARSYGRFIRNRLARLAPLHWVMLGAYLAIYLATRFVNVQINNIEVFDFSCLPYNFAFLHAAGLCRSLSFNGVSWSISAEMFMYIAAPAIFWICLRSLMLTTGLAIVLLFSLFCLWGGDKFVVHTFDFGVIRALPSFVLGVCFYNVRDTIAAIPCPRFVLTGSLAGYFFGCVFGAPPPLLLGCLYLAVAAGVAADAGNRSGSVVRALAAGGQLTYSSYMLHAFVSGIVVTFIAERVLRLSGIELNLTIACTFVLVWPLSFFSYTMFERPMRKWISTLGRTKASGSEVLAVIRATVDGSR
jgi:peptidoglycan/LPS O-acetylase OafA/YrhL